MTGCATDVGLILGRALGRLLRKDGCGFTQPEKNRLGLYGRLSLGFVGGAAVGQPWSRKPRFRTRGPSSCRRESYSPRAVSPRSASSTPASTRHHSRRVSIAPGSSERSDLPT